MPRRRSERGPTEGRAPGAPRGPSRPTGPAGSTLWSVLAWLCGLGLVGIAAGALGFYILILRELPDLRGVADYRPAIVSVVYDRGGQPIGEFFEERRRLIPLDQVPEHVVMAFVAAEDDSFFEHKGIDYRSILRAAWVDLTAGELRQGASTITQQTVKSLLLTPERRFERKIKELVLAKRLEASFTKDEILSLYLNQIYFGSGAYGIGEAARTYFGKEAAELTVGEGALLAGLPKAPTRYSPRVDPEAAEKRRQYVLGRMLDLGVIDAAQFESARAQSPVLVEHKEIGDFEAASWFNEQVRRYLFQELPDDLILRGGLRVETTLDLELQRAATLAVREGLRALDRRQGWAGPVHKAGQDELEREIARAAEANGLGEASRPADDEVDMDPLAVLRDREPPLVGIVVALDKETNRARVALGPGVEGQVALEAVAWARPRNSAAGAAPRKHIAEVFRVGDVAHFALRTGAKANEPDPGAAAPELELFQEPEVEGALVALDVGSGDVLALVGGYDFGRSQFDRAIQARRQPGSAFKPVIYAAALQHGFTAVTTIYDRPVVYSDPASGFEWRPENYGRRFLGPLPLREALARSVNNATIHLLRDIGVDPALELALRLGIRAPLERNLSLALGASPVSLLELTRAYAVFPAGGRLLPATFVRRVVDRDGNVLLENVPLVEDEPLPVTESGEADEHAPRETKEDTSLEPGESAAPVDPTQRLDPVDAYLALDLVRGVVEHPRGTGRRARALGRPLGGKTGTTNDQGDAWFVGFSAQIVAGTWVGFDERKLLGRGETGGRAALPIWIDFMREAHEGRRVLDFPVPEGVNFARIDRETGKLADSQNQDAYFQAFRVGEEPTERASDVLSASDSRKVQRLDF